MTVMRGGAAMLARYMDESLAIPTATSFRTIAVTHARRAAAASSRTPARSVSFTHLIAFAIARAATEQPVMADHFAEVDGKPARVRDGAVNLGLAVDVEQQGRLAHADGPGDPRRRRARASTRFLAAYDALVEKARTNTLDRRRPRGREHDADQPRRARHDRVGAAADAGTGHDRRDGSIAYPPGPRARSASRSVRRR